MYTRSRRVFRLFVIGGCWAGLLGVMPADAEELLIRVAGSTTVQPIVAQAAKQFHELQPEVRVVVGAGGSGHGIKAVAQGEVQIGMASPVLELASRIAMTHHEKWDGSGYPLGLAGADIPVEGRITAVADVFDALSSKRSYKPALPLDRCFAILEEERGKHFDPRVLDAFLARCQEVVAVRIDLAERN